MPVDAVDMSPWGLFMQADIVVKAVMVMLLLASVWCWAIMFEKSSKLRRARKDARRFEDAFWSASSLDVLYDKVAPKVTDPMSAIFAAGMKEWKRAGKAPDGRPIDPDALQHRVESVMGLTISREMERLERQMTVLASVGSTAPFIGLFGTVWGIMNAFAAIAAEKNTNLAVVAPGIAEALFATALGLVAAIPAVLAFNKYSRDLARYADRLDQFTVEFGAILSRHFEGGAK
ncbi:MAG: hypothetical protein Alpg2KO_17870 [Alphaproteobacteria bacterium]